jgi:membrane associated rhomboid family serine protease
MSATNVIIVLNVIFFIIQNLIKHAIFIFGLNYMFLEAGFYWQPLTSMFMHGGVGHLVMNMAVLFQFGNMLESIKGKVYFLKLYLIGGLLTSLFSFLFIYFFELNHVLVGASGAISVLFGQIAHKDRYNRKGIIVVILLISFVPLLMGINIAWYAHLIGFTIGWFWAAIK